MSIESAKAFMERMTKDQEFAKKIMAETTTESRMALARDAGFHLTAEEMAQSTEKLTDDDLDQVVGGAALLSKNFMFT